MELIDAKTTPCAQSESSSETHPTNDDAKTKSLSLLVPQRHHPMVVSYRECLKNHAASLGGHALDGCGEFMPSPTDLKCAACGCHRNFHRRDPYDGPAFIRHLPPPPPNDHPSSSPSPTNSTSPSPTHTPPSPVPYSYYSSAPHMLLALSTGYTGPLDEYNHSNPRVGVTDKNNSSSNTSRKKRSRTKFSKEQKEKMHAFADRVGWRMPRGSEEKLLKEFCNEVGVERGVLKVWMHNNKNTFGKKDILTVGNLNLHSNNNEDDNGTGNGNAGNSLDSNVDTHNNEYCIQLHVTNNGPSSAS
ncbi:Zinc-finger homeodomain protein 11 [Hibiscus syriacus]|uniref:Zinc-finger homeodomain protein 11 n=1 Tax=Hibiscus syriacus TaxID=106335 RepID=A0A6A2YCT8_HIBSY|nr:zinc-finger homeodomain protein 11-like [Hibiscus syriacus]KAE8673229.1 Zinc-finger homeodomain protein 11 [Hibiscus syriacus]